jgi:hypothetical protein
MADILFEKENIRAKTINVIRCSTRDLFTIWRRLEKYKIWFGGGATRLLQNNMFFLIYISQTYFLAD